jgi:hypothetical protein
MAINHVLQLNYEKSGKVIKTFINVLHYLL